MPRVLTELIPLSYSHIHADGVPPMTLPQPIESSRKRRWQCGLSGKFRLVQAAKKMPIESAIPIESVLVIAATAYPN
jgi:hypothetical protein